MCEDKKKKIGRKSANIESLMSGILHRIRKKIWKWEKEEKGATEEGRRKKKDAKRVE